MYEGARAARPDKRVFILTRSGFAGIQRNAAAVWSGDIVSRWDDLYNQISAGVSIGYSGIPNWTFDIGGFANEARYSTQKPAAADLEEWRELNLRWFQFGAFVPLFRSHGEFPLREIYNIAPQGSEVYDSLVWHDKLRYRLLPYIYTRRRGHVSPRRHHHARPGDGLRRRSTARDVRDEYLFGKAFLVAPVYQFKARDAPGLSTGGCRAGTTSTPARRHAGGQTVEAAAPLAACRCTCAPGSIVPVGPDDPVLGREARRARSRCSCSPAATAASISTKTTA